MTKPKWNVVDQRQTKKKLFDTTSIFLLLTIVFGAVFCLLQVRLIGQSSLDFLTLSAAVRPDGGQILSNQMNQSTTSIFVSDKFVTLASLKNMLGLNDKKDFLILPRKDFLQDSVQVAKLKSQFPNSTKQIAILMDMNTASHLNDWTELTKIQSQLNHVFKQEHTFLIVK